MKTARLLLPVASFAVAALAVRFWPRASGVGETPRAPTASSVFPASEKSSVGPGQFTGAGPVSGPAGFIADQASQNPPTINEVFAATGLDRMLLMARFIQTASAADLAAVIDRAAANRIFETAISRQAWLRWVEVDLEGALQHKPARSAWEAFSKLNPEAALSRALQTNRSMLGAVLYSIGQSDPGMARRFLAAHPDIDPAHAMSGMIKGLGKSDPESAAMLALDQGGSALDAQLKLWMERDPDGALAWVRGLTKPGDRRRVEESAMACLIATDPAAGLRAARQLPPGRRQADHTVEAIKAMAHRDPAGARAAAEAIEAPSIRDQALAGLAVSLSTKDPAATAALVSAIDWEALRNAQYSSWSYTSPEGAMSSGYGRDAVIDSTLTALMASAPQVTADALASLTDRPYPGSGPLSKAVQKWAALQPEAASAWLRNQASGPARDQGIQGLAQWLTVESPEPDFAAAVAWAGAATEARQEELYDNIFAGWKQKDFPAAAAALEAMPIAPGQRDRLRLKLHAPAPADPFAR